MFKTKLSQELYERLYNFARDCTWVAKGLSQGASNQIYTRQLIRSSASIPANYIEAQESLSRKDFLYRLLICRKESKESIQWLRLIADTNNPISEKIKLLLGEAGEFLRIFSKAVETTRAKDPK